jgi:hypothetical protein
MPLRRTNAITPGSGCVCCSGNPEAGLVANEPTRACHWLRQCWCGPTFRRATACRRIVALASRPPPPTPWRPSRSLRPRSPPPREHPRPRKHSRSCQRRERPGDNTGASSPVAVHTNRLSNAVRVKLARFHTVGARPFNSHPPRPLTPRPNLRLETSPRPPYHGFPSRTVRHRPGELQSPGTGPSFGEKTHFARKRLAENIDPSPSRQATPYEPT